MPLPDPAYADWNGYAAGRYTRGREFEQLVSVDTWWLTLGGSTTDPFGFGLEIERQRAAARELNSL